METALIASECEDWEHRREDPDAWTYWENADLVAALDRAESAESELAALRQWAEEAESRALEYAKKADAAIARAEATGQALTALHAAQNGPPLLRDAPEWNAAMKMTEAVLGLNPADAVLSSTPTPQLKVRIA